MVLRYLTMKLLVISITFVVEQPGMGWEKWRRMHWCHSKTLYDQNFFSSKCDFFLAHKSWGFGEPEVERNRICIWPSVWKSFRQKVLCRNGGGRGFSRLKNSKTEKVSTSVMKAYPAGDSSVAVTGEDWLGILNFQLLMPHIDIFKNYTVEERVRLIQSITENTSSSTGLCWVKAAFLILLCFC